MRSFFIYTFLPAGLVLAIGALVCLPQTTTVLRAQNEGKVVFVDAACARCHSVESEEIEATVSERMQGPDLGTVGTEHDAAWVVAVVKRETELDAGPHRAPFRGSDDQLDIIAAWLVGLE